MLEFLAAFALTAAVGGVAIAGARALTRRAQGQRRVDEHTHGTDRQAPDFEGAGRAASTDTALALLEREQWKRAPLDLAKLGADLGSTFGPIGTVIGAVAGAFAGAAAAIFGSRHDVRQVRTIVRNAVVRELHKAGRAATDAEVLYVMHGIVLAACPWPVGFSSNGELHVAFPRPAPAIGRRDSWREFLAEWLYDPVREYAAATGDGVHSHRLVAARQAVGPYDNPGTREIEEVRPSPGVYRIEPEMSDRNVRGIESNLVSQPLEEPELQLVATRARDAGLQWSIPSEAHGALVEHLELVGQAVL